MSFLLTKTDLLDLSVSQHTDYSAVILDTLDLIFTISGLLKNILLVPI